MSQAAAILNAPSIALEGRCQMGQTHLFGPLKLVLEAGHWTCLLGPSGIGKTTLLRLVAGLPIGGAFDGMITASDGQAIAGRASYMAQNDLLLPWLTVLDNVVIGARLRQDKPDIDGALKLIERIGLAEHVSKKPHALSGGMRQRAALARTLMEARPIVLLDEPFSALDAGMRAEMQELAAQTLADRTVFLVTHDPNEAARLGHQILMMEHGGITAIEPPATPPIRDADGPETLECQARLLRALRRAHP